MDKEKKGAKGVPAPRGAVTTHTCSPSHPSQQNCVTTAVLPSGGMQSIAIIVSVCLSVN